ncbi:hypothetical protein JD292_09540 [Leucobacter sp. CSA2]|uniref:Peptidase C45 hydrolase domain-containing protein n=1 Tax=Leucobacter edaphi TaxID=2796472 RepID=A0A934UXQ7_9MICO|nr:C45 family peptidase [Leucobacter edaphi]MBK0422315.1 hypothetical protein [Leucobacter edaphi]
MGWKSETERPHIEVTGATPFEIGLSRGRALAGSLAEASAAYDALFRSVGVTVAAQAVAVEQVLRTLSEWRPAVVAELSGVAEGAGVELAEVVALNARTEILALAGGAPECSTVTAVIDGARVGAQTWDWHIELDRFWHTQVVHGTGLSYAGLTEQGILSKIGINEGGLALHFNILFHAEDGAGGVPMHLLSHAILTECRSVEEALELLGDAPIGSSSALTLLDRERAVALELSPVGVFEIGEVDGSVQRTNHFLNSTPLAGQKTAQAEPDSSARLALIRSRLEGGLPRDEAGLVDLLVSGEGEAPLTCRPDLSLPVGEHWATLATVVTEPERGRIRILDGMPTEAETGAWRVLEI